MDPQQIALVKASFLEALALPESLADVFYDRLFAAAGDDFEALGALLVATEAFTAAVDEFRRRARPHAVTLTRFSLVLLGVSAFNCLTLSLE